MEAEGTAPEWMAWVEPEVAQLSDPELDEFVANARRFAQEARQARQAVDRTHPDAQRLGYAAWGYSKRESMGLREKARRAAQRNSGDEQ